MTKLSLPDYLSALELLWPALLAAIGGTWAVCHVIYKSHIETQNSRIKLREDERDTARTLLTKAECELADEKARAPANGPAALPEPDPSSKRTASAEVKRDVELPEALAFAALRQWGRRFIEAAGSEGTDANAELNRFMQLAADGELSVWGRQREGGVFIKIPAEEFQTRELAWFELLRGNARFERNALESSFAWHDIMVSTAEFERCWPIDRAGESRTSSNVALDLSIEIRRLCDVIDEFTAKIHEDRPAGVGVAQANNVFLKLFESRHPVWLRDEVRAIRGQLSQWWNGMRSSGTFRATYFEGDDDKAVRLDRLEDITTRLKAGLRGEPIPPGKEHF